MVDIHGYGKKNRLKEIEEERAKEEKAFTNKEDRDKIVKDTYG